ncbi:uncharacterized protein MKK02DRAFT_41064 [Dioszegia hungarica]|uniref:Uncharacterized protein n=1 Tax=Dioszegia hungarica TaxID=4972 RepID=A0AA38H543_9TREE|nr:uncharacterized protein MKK02DRAFT_41064 [Dioszegia hungarica]KAI9632754.1 hypothetical protein MKK02DRAFT_41064 [Dioszegia hungarica]
MSSSTTTADTHPPADPIKRRSSFSSDDSSCPGPIVGSDSYRRRTLANFISFLQDTNDAAFEQAPGPTRPTRQFQFRTMRGSDDVEDRESEVFGQPSAQGLEVIFDGEGTRYCTKRGPESEMEPDKRLDVIARSMSGPDVVWLTQVGTEMQEGTATREDWEVALLTVFRGAYERKKGSVGGVWFEELPRASMSARFVEGRAERRCSGITLTFRPKVAAPK